MRKYLCLFAVMLCLSGAAVAAPGDTTWVYANNTYLDGYGSYDSLVKFPVAGKTYRKIYMIFTLGKHTCPSGSTWCGDWDYTVQSYLMKPGGKALELGRFISPYANANAPRTPFTWQQHYVFDVTDYEPELHDSATMRIFYSGYSGGFTGNIKFAFIEGMPDRDVTGIKRMWNGSFGYGGSPSINSHFTPMKDTAPVYTKSAELKFTVTGHGSDANGCCEFMSHDYKVLLGNSYIGKKTIWRDNCGLNELFPQSGTWIHNRANWCPGAIVNSDYQLLPSITAGVTYDLSLEFDAYSGGGSYTTEGQVFYYGAMKKKLDASIDEIIAPTNDENHFRGNPICGSPVIHITNRGSNTIDSIAFQYGIPDSAMQTYVWKGKLKTFEETDVTLPELAKLKSMAGATGTYKFAARITGVNGVAQDVDTTNNIMTSSFNVAPLWPSAFRVTMNTNNEGLVSKPTMSETSWAVYDMNGNVVKKRDNALISTIYSDTVSLPTGCYKLQIYDSSCDGLNWWAFGGTGTTSGSFFVRKLGTTTNIPMNGYTYVGTYAHDFGCGFSQYFTVYTPVPEGITNVTEEALEMTAYPNPAQNTVSIDIAGIQDVRGTLHLIDALGRVVSVMKCNEAHQQMNVAGLANGVYTVLFVNEASGNKLTTRLLIAK